MTEWDRLLLQSDSVQMLGGFSDTHTVTAWAVHECSYGEHEDLSLLLCTLLWGFPKSSD